MNHSTSFRSFFNKIVSTATIVAVLSMYAQPILVAHAGEDVPTPSTPSTGGSDNNGASSDTGAGSSDASSSSSIDTPSTGGADSDGTTDIPVPPTGGSDNNGASSDTGASASSTASTTPPVPSTGGADNNGAQGSTSTSTSTTTAPVDDSGTPTTPTSSSVIFSGGGGGGGIGQANGSTGGNFSTTSLALAASTNTGIFACPFMTGFIIPGNTAGISGSVNDPAQISKLQAFLNAYENDSAVIVTGVLDQPTISGILSFQEKYLAQTMGPWGLTVPSGNVYLTTLHQINTIVCGPQPALIIPFHASVNAGNASAGIVGSTTTIGTRTSSTTGSTNGTPNNSLLTGNVVSSGLGSFFANLFGKIFKFFGGN